MRSDSLRHQHADVLRAFALLGVFIVNGMGYSVAPDHVVPLGQPIPLDSSVSAVVYALLFFLFQGKAWPLLCFLFGYSLQSMATLAFRRGAAVKAVLRSRYAKLFVIGLLHGLFIYFGDVLTTYAVCGWIATRWAISKGRYRTKLSTLLRVWKICLLATAVLLALMLLISWMLLGADNIAAQPRQSFAAVQGWQDFLQLNRKFYGYTTSTALTFFLPLYVGLTISGMLAYRLGLLSRRRYAQRWWQRAPATLPTIISSCLTLVIAMLATMSQTAGMHESFTSMLVVMSIPVGIGWIYCCASLYMRHIRLKSFPVLVQLARSAKYTLPMYLGLSVFLVIFKNPVFGGWMMYLPQSTLMTLVFLLMLWLAAVKLALIAHARGWKDPLSRWLAIGKLT